MGWNPRETGELEGESLSDARAARAAFLRSLDRRLALLARELGALVSRAGVSAGETEEAATRLLRAMEVLSGDLAAARSVPEAGWTEAKKRLEASWKPLRRSFEELVLAGGQRHRTGLGVSRRRPRW